MMEIKVPTLGESVTEATVAQWFVAPGEAIAVDEPLVELETDKVTVEVPAPASGVLESIAVEDGATVEVGALLGILTPGEAVRDKGAAEAEAGTPAVAVETHLAPSVRKIVEENNLDPASIEGTGKDGRLVKGDVLAALADVVPPVTA
ncbi:MAG TPA: dihydrolipoamide succinyltransferase, partial [Rhizobiales bacterium]|nr:dihydrolipoamide succinyltransferase [Hyphomicrobiales bacterium]